MFQDSSSVISRVAGFTCLHVLRGHSGCVQALTAVEGWSDGGTYLVSGRSNSIIGHGAWDRKAGALLACIYMCMCIHEYYQCISVHYRCQEGGI